MPHSYRALETVTGRPVVIHLFPGLSTRPEQLQELASQVRLFHSVRGDQSRVRFVDLDSERPFVVLDAADDSDLDSFIGTAPAEAQLAWLAEFLHGLNRAIQSRLYHGALTLASLRVGHSAQPGCYIDYLHRFCTATQATLPLTAFELYQSDVIQGLAVAAHVVACALERSLLDSVVPARKLAILKRLCHDRLSGQDWDQLFDGWLEWFEEWLPERSTLPAPGMHAGDATAELAAYQEWNSPALNPAEPLTREVSTRDSDPTSRTASVSAGDELRAGTMLGRFRVEGLIGRGGMGAVYRGVDTSDGALVALKVLRAQGATAAQAVRRFQKEGRILASIRNEHVTQLLEVGKDRDVHYIAMEFVHGIDLKKWLRNRMPLEERSALRITADIARALAEAHQRNIIHRDIKPENVLISSRVSGSGDAATVHTALEDCVVKLSDFGIAREMEQSQSMEVTRAGGLLGTPRYMSPEQCKGGSEICPATDIYALGITLYEMLCGSVPFDDDDVMKLAALHCFEPLTDIRKRNQRVSEATSQLVHRMLAKKTSDRPADALQLIAEIQRILEGRASEFDSHPQLPQFDSSRLWQRVFQWELQSSPAALWPHVSNTERLNRAVGLPTVEYRTVKDAALGIRRFGSFRLGGVNIEWEEHPFEWIEGSRMGVLREFSSGPFKWFMNTVELKPRADGGTQLIHTVKIEPRNAFGRVVSTIEAGWKGGRALDRVYRRIDESLRAPAATGISHDVFEAAPTLPRRNSKRVEARLDDMIAKGADWDAAHKLVEHLRTASIQELSKLRPMGLAQQLDVAPAQMIDVCLLAAAAGLLVLQWDVLCPSCRVSAKTESLLANIQQHTQCEACDTQFQSNIASALEMTFRVHPEIRETISGKYCIGGPWHAPHVVTQIRVAAGERIALSLRLDAGDYLVRTVGMPDVQMLAVRHAATASEVNFRYPLIRSASQAPTVRAGMVELVLTNDGAARRTFRLERTIQRDQVVTAAVASTLQRFRETFPDQVVTSGAPIVAEDLSLFVLQFHGLDQLYHDLGERDAYDVCHRMLADIESTVVGAGGALVKTWSEGLLASFQDCAAACQAALATQRNFRERYAACAVLPGIAVHRGKTLIAQQNGRIDYFGATLRNVSKLATKAAGSLVLTEAVYSDPVVHQLLIGQGIAAETSLMDDDQAPSQLIQQIRLN